MDSRVNTDRIQIAYTSNVAAISILNSYSLRSNGKTFLLRSNQIEDHHRKFKNVFLAKQVWKEESKWIPDFLTDWV